MREILFRGKRFSDGEWVDGSLFIDDKGEKHEVMGGYVNYRVTWEVAPETVGQYTGQTDKHGKKIFEDDIVTVQTQGIDEDDGPATVVWNDDSAQFELVFDGLITSFDSVYGHECEVIGNIHDNPELLSGGIDNA